MCGRNNKKSQDIPSVQMRSVWADAKAAPAKLASLGDLRVPREVRIEET